MTRPTGPDDPITRALADVHRQVVTDRSGHVADYIPDLATADPEPFGIALVSAEGRTYRTGDADLPFTIQSISKPFAYALALCDLGRDAVLERVGCEPSGEAFNAIRLEEGTGRPPNPMVNAGAIVTSSLVSGADPEERFGRIRDLMARAAGHELALDANVYSGEQDTGHRNRALAHLMRSMGALTVPVEDAVSVYFRQCSVLVTATDLAVMGATLADGGTNPVTGERVLPAEVAAQVLTVMATCGMYDYAGEWLLRAGLPAKSGVAGGLLAASPGQFGVGLFSPRLDRRGNSVRGVAAAQELSRRFGLHLMHYAGPPVPATWLSGTARDHPSTTVRREAERDHLAAHADRIAVRALKGELEFAAAEAVLAGLPGGPDSGTDWLVVDLTEVDRVHPAARRMLGGRLDRLRDEGVRVVVSDAAHRDLLGPVPGTGESSSLDEAVTACEDELLDRAGLLVRAPLTLAEHDALRGVDPDVVSALGRYDERRAVAPGEDAFRPGDLLVLVLAGTVTVESASGPGWRPVVTYAAGTGLGLPAARGPLGSRRRVLARTPAEVAVVSRVAMGRLEHDDPLRLAIFLHRMLQAATGEAPLVP